MTDIGVFLTAPTAWGTGLALLFGAVWLVALRPMGWRRWPAWAAFAAGAALFPPAIAWLQAPLQELVGGWFQDRLGPQGYYDLLLLTGIPAVALGALVQEAAKLAPVLVFRWRSGGDFACLRALSIGAMAGAGFGVYEAQWMISAITTGGWGWSIVEANGIIELAAFWERFFAVGFHAGVTALAALGLARGWGWWFYLLASALHFLFGYRDLFLGSGLATTLQIEIYVAVFAGILFAAVLLLRGRASASEAGAFITGTATDTR